MDNKVRCLDCKHGLRRYVFMTDHVYQVDCGHSSNKELVYDPMRGAGYKFKEPIEVLNKDCSCKMFEKRDELKPKISFFKRLFKRDTSNKPPEKPNKIPCPSCKAPKSENKATLTTTEPLPVLDVLLNQALKETVFNPATYLALLQAVGEETQANTHRVEQDNKCFRALISYVSNIQYYLLDTHSVLYNKKDQSERTKNVIL